MANLITLGRLVLFFLTIAMIYTHRTVLIQVAALLMIVVIASDALDGYVARRRGSTSDFGSVADIAGDRVVEQCAWVVFAHLGLLGVWVPLLVITRGIAVDTLRALAFREGKTAFGPKTMARSPLTEWLTASRTMRALYGIAKAVAFVFLTGLVPGDDGQSAVAFFASGPLWWFGWLNVWGALVLMLARGIPVITDAWEFTRGQRIARHE